MGQTPRQYLGEGQPELEPIHLNKELTAPCLSAVALLSPSRLAHLFTAQTGTPLRGYVEAQRMEAAPGCWR